MIGSRSIGGVLSLLLLCSCELKKDFNKGEPSTEAKGDRPQETGEGLPGYLIDPELLVSAQADGKTTVTGAADAVRLRKAGSREPQKVLAIGYKRTAKAYRRDGDAFIVSGRLLTSVSSAANGSFAMSFVIDADETLFLRLADAYAENEVAFIPGKAADDRVLLDAASGRFVSFTEDNSQTIAYDIDPVGTQATQVATLKATRTCRSCNLSGVNLAATNLNGCTLTGAKLVGTDLTGSDLRNCQLQNADLSSANLSKADLSGANLTGAVLSNAVLTDAILTNVKGYQP